MSKESKQQQFLDKVAERIPGLIKAIAKGNSSAEHYLGSKTLPDGTVVELYLKAQNGAMKGWPKDKEG